MNEPKNCRKCGKECFGTYCRECFSIKGRSNSARNRGHKHYIMKLEKKVIIHKLSYSKDSYENEGSNGPLRKLKRYFCIQACSTTKDKLSYRWDKVTCKNCLKWRKKENGFELKNTGTK
jgi:hypothetical protein